jgi:hypothetical protein
MSTKRWLMIAVVLTAILSVSAVAIFAQDDGDGTFPPFGPMGRGGMMGGHHMMWDSDTPPMFAAVAEALGIDEETLFAEFQSGKSITDLAEEYGVDLTTLSETWLATMTTHLNAMVEAGILTQEQANARLALMSENFETMPMFNGPHPMFGGMMGGMHGGMWGRGGMMGRGPNF